MSAVAAPLTGGPAQPEQVQHVHLGPQPRLARQGRHGRVRRHGRRGLPGTTWLLAAFFVSLPLLNRELPVVGGSLIVPVALVVGLTTLAPAVRSGYRPQRSSVVLSVGLYVTLQLAGALRQGTISGMVHAGSTPLMVFVGLLGAGAVMWSARREGRDEPTTRVLLGAFLLAGLLSSVAALLMRHGSLAVADGGSVIDNRATGLFVQPNELGGWSAMGFVLAASLLRADRRWLRSLAIVCLALDGAGLVVSTSRGAWLGTGLGLVFLVVSSAPLRRALSLAGAGVVTACWVAVLAGVRPAVGLLQLIGDRIASAGHMESAAFDDRPAIYARAWETWLRHPVAGVGTSMFPSSATAADSAVRVVDPLHAHSLVLETLAEGGLLGMVAVVAVALSVTFAHLRLRAGRQPITMLHLSSTAVVIAAAGLGILDYPWTNAVLLTAVFLALGLVSHSEQQPSPPIPENRRNGKQI